MTPFQRSSRLPAIPSWRVIFDNPLAAGWWTGFVLFNLLSALLIARRGLGSFEQPATFIVLVIVATAAVGVTLLLRRSHHLPIASRDAGTMELGLLGSLSLPCLLLMLALSMSGASLPGIIVSWCLIVGIESSWWTRAVSRWRESQHSPRVNPTAIASANEPANEAVGERSSYLVRPDEPATESFPESVSQQLTRADDGEGRESVDGWLRVTFEPHERQKSAHIAFCPPLSSQPEFHVEQIDGPLAIVEIGQLESFGVRLEVRLERLDPQKSSVVCQFEARG